MAIELIVEELRQAGVDLRDITLLCAQGLHRKLSRTEMETFLGRRPGCCSFGYNNLYCHDAEDPEQLVHLGYTHRGFDVEVNRAVVDSDQLIYLNTMWAPFNGGWKSAAVGLGTFRSIRHHHRPWPTATGHSVDDPKSSAFKKLVWEQGRLIEDALAKKGRRVFTLESVYDNSEPKKDLIAVNAGHPDRGTSPHAQGDTGPARRRRPGPVGHPGRRNRRQLRVLLQVLDRQHLSWPSTRPWPTR